MIGFITGTASYKNIINQNTPVVTSVDDVLGAVCLEYATPDTLGDTFVCPILYEEGKPYILIDEGEPVLVDFEKKQLDLFSTNPLSVLNKREIVERIRHRLHTVLSGTAIKGLIEN